MIVADKITAFRGEYRFLSNFWPAQVVLDCYPYPSVEHAYVAAKTLDPISRHEIRCVPSPAAVKRFGRTLKLRSDWESIKLDVMQDLVRQKFKDPVLGLQLRSTWPMAIEEGNTWGDTFWGVCAGVGANHLGKILMLVRNELLTRPITSRS